jgi:hypothetical protein
MAENIEHTRPVQKGPNGQVDPTANVLALVEAAVQRINDLQDAATLRIESLRELDNKRIDELRIAEARRLDEQATLRENYHDKLSLAESKRIDAIRAVDVAAVAVASERATAQATVLASQVSTSAEALRTLVATTASTTNAQQTTAWQQFTDRLTALERAQYEGKGKSAIADPQIQELVTEMKSLRESRSTITGKDEGAVTSKANLRANIATAIAVAGFLSTMFLYFSNALPRAIPAAAPAQPQIIYVTAQPAQPTPNK